MALGEFSPGNRSNFPNGFAVAIGCAFARSGALHLRCNVLDSRGAVTTPAGRTCFGLSNGAGNAVRGRCLGVGTTGFARASSSRLPANRLNRLTNAVVSFTRVRGVNSGVSRPFETVVSNVNCSGGCYLTGDPHSFARTTILCSRRDNERVRICASLPKIRLCYNN